jgi:UDP-GlcNAc:undecaprenyl-phosphate GlcNAc-1-phosphate transferase
VTIPLTIYGLAILGAWLVTFVTMPLWRAGCQRAGLVDHPGHRKIHDAPVPLAGGLAVLTGLLLPLLAAVLALNLPTLPHTRVVELLQYGLGRRAVQLTALLGGALGMVALGWFDDKHELRPGVKFGGQLLIALLVALAGIRITLFVPSLVFSYAVTILWILSVTNAFNFMDNMNGLCAGLGIIGAWAFAWTAAVQGQYLVALIAFLTCGALLGFLPYNFPTASVFLGDAGSHLVGYLLAVLAILPHFYTSRNPRMLAVLTPVLVLAVPLLDLVWVVLLRWRRGQPFYIGDTSHLSHRLVQRGFGKTTAVLFIWLLAALIGGLSFLI